MAHLAPIEDIVLAELTAEDIERTLAGMTTRRGRTPKPASAKTVRNVQIMLRTALGHAHARGYMERNVARLVPLRHVQRRPIDAMTPETARAVLDAVAGDRYEAAYALAMVGLRASEVLGLVWEDVDLRRRTVNVRAQLVGSGEHAQRAQLKTAASERPVPLPEFVVTRLRDHRDAQLLERIAAGVSTEDGHVFVTADGLPVNGSWLTKHFGALLAAAGLPKMGLHALRHGAASLLVGAGVHPRVAQELLRHASSRTTMELYAHVSAGQEREAADVLDRVVSG
jgi:integrase